MPTNEEGREGDRVARQRAASSSLMGDEHILGLSLSLSLGTRPNACIFDHGGCFIDWMIGLYVPDYEGKIA